MESYDNSQVSTFNSIHPPTMDSLFKISYTLTPQAKDIIDSIWPNKPHSLKDLVTIANNDIQRYTTQLLVKALIIHPFIDTFAYSLLRGGFK